MPKIQHMVLLKFKADVTPEKITELFDLLGELQDLISGITYYSGGSYSSHEGLNQGYTHGFLMTFESVTARDAYLPHPEHERVKAALLPHLDSVIAFDFESNC
ncbi:MAG TPA: Dabb family protein [Cyanophyceae cyanobacterium]